MALHNSHFIGRANKAVRYDPQNCDAACFGCHRRWEANAVTEYRDWKIAQLGQEAYDHLIERSRTITKRTPEQLEVLSEQISAWLFDVKKIAATPKKVRETKRIEIREVRA